MINSHGAHRRTEARCSGDSLSTELLKPYSSAFDASECCSARQREKSVRDPTPQGCVCEWLSQHLHEQHAGEADDESGVRPGSQAPVTDDRQGDEEIDE